jgi:disulfide bond formation protein DsbB
MIRPTPRLLWSTLAAGCLALVVGSLVLTLWLDLQPCHLCIFQRLLFMVLTVLALAAAWLAPRPSALLPGLLTLPCAVGGIGAAAYQVWLQGQPPGSVSCIGGKPGPIELMVEWLGQRQPDLFLATGFCEETELVILGLSLAGWALVSFLGCLGLAVWALWPRAMK